MNYKSLLLFIFLAMLHFDGSFFISHGDLYSPALLTSDSLTFREKSEKYSQILSNLFRSSEIGESINDCKVIGFGGIEKITVFFRLELDRRKVPR